MKRRNLILLLGGTGSAALGTGTGAFSSAEAERDVEVSVVEDGSAYVGYAKPQVNSENELVATEHDRVTLVRITNRFSDDSKIGVVDVEFNGNGDLFRDLEVSRSNDGDHELMTDREIRGGPYEAGGPVPEKYAFGPGEYADVTAVVDRDPGEPVGIEVTVQIRGAEDAGVSAEIFGDTRAFTLVVEDNGGAANVSSVDFEPGNSGIVIGTNEDNSGFQGASTQSGGTVEAIAHYKHGNEIKETEKAPVQTNQRIKLKQFDDSLSNRRILGVEVVGVDGIFYRGETSAPGNSDNNNGVVNETVPSETFPDEVDE